MGNLIEIELPDEIAHYKSDVSYFFETMIRKLYLNRHKGFAEGLDPHDALDLVNGEILEARVSLEEAGQFEAYVECADIANCAFITGMATTRLTRVDFETMKKERKNAK